MIATQRGLAIACAIAVALAALAIAGRPEPAAPVDPLLARALVPRFAADTVRELAWARPGAPEIRIARDRSAPTGWAWAQPPGAADARAIDDALAALRGGRWQRRAPAAAAGRPTITLTISRAPAVREPDNAAPADSAAPLTIAIGEPLAGADQQWLAIGAHAYLVDAWIARALAPDPLALRIRRPLAAIASAEQIQLSPGGDRGRAVLSGHPRALGSGANAMLLDPSAVAAIEQPLAALEVLELPRAPVAPHGIGIVAGGITVRDAGACPSSPGRRAIDGTAGPGCVDERAWDSVARAIATLAQPPAQLVERRPIPLEIAKLVLADGAVLDLSGQPRLGDRDADLDAARDTIAALAAPAEPIPLPAAKPTGALVASDRAGRSLRLHLYAAGALARAGEPVALRVGPAVWQLLVRPSRDLRDPTLWREEPTTISAIEIDGTSYTRGAVIGEWIRRGPGRDAPDIVEQLATALAAPRARSHAASGVVRHTMTLQIQPIGGAPTRRTLQLTAMENGRCDAIIDGDRVALSIEICRLATTLTP